MGRIDKEQVMVKARQVLGSRKFWATLLATGAVFVLWLVGEVDADLVARLVAILAGVYMGSVALEDGLSRLRDAVLGPEIHTMDGQ